MNSIKRAFWDEGFQRLRAFWRLLLHLFILVLVTVIVNAGGVAVVSGISGTPLDVEGLMGGQGAAAPELQWLGLLFPLTTLISFVIAIWLAGRWLDRRRFVDFGLRFSRDWWIDFGFGLGLGALLMALVFLVEWSAGWLTITGTLQSPDGVGFGVAILTPLVLFFSVGIYEELWSRGYQLKNVAEGFAFWGIRVAVLIALLLTSALFGLLHATNPNATPVSTFNLFLAGIFLGLGFVLTGELAIPIGLHMTWNFFQGNVFGFPVSGTTAGRTSFIAIEQGGNPLITGGAFGPEAGLIGIAAMVLGSLLTIWWVRWRYGQARIHPSLVTPELLRPPAPVAADEPASRAEEREDERVRLP
jgi:hypothetical protein